MMLGISYEKALEQARKDAYGGKINRFEFGPVKYLHYRDLNQDKVVFDEAGMHTITGEVELLFVDDKLIFSYLDFERKESHDRQELMALNYAEHILGSAVWCFQEGNFKDDETIDDEIKKTAEWLENSASFRKDYVNSKFVKFVADGEHYWNTKNAMRYLRVPRNINDSILEVLIAKKRSEEDFE